MVYYIIWQFIMLSFNLRPFNPFENRSTEKHDDEHMCQNRRRNNVPVKLCAYTVSHAANNLHNNSYMCLYVVI